MCEYAYPGTGDAHAFSRQIPRCMMPSPATTMTTASATRIGVHQLAPVLTRQPAGPPTASLLARTSESSRVGVTGCSTCTGTGYPGHQSVISPVGGPVVVGGPDGRVGDGLGDGGRLGGGVVGGPVGGSVDSGGGGAWVVGGA